MGSVSPNRLVVAPGPQVAKMGRWPLYVLLGMLLLLGCILIYSVSFLHGPKDEEEKGKAVVVQEEEKPVWLVEGSGLALDPKKDRTSGVLAPPVEAPPAPEKLVVVQREEKPDQEMENYRRMKAQAYLDAINAPLIAKRVSDSSASQTLQTEGGTVPNPGKQENGNVTSGNASVGSDSFYDPAADRDKEAFFSRAGNSQWRLQERRTAGLPFELKTGAVIPGVMITGINSDLPGVMIAQVAQNIFDTATGKSLLIPQGTKIYGVYDSRVIYGQERVLIAWNRLIFPDGSSITLGAMPGADMSGMAGFNDEVNNHYLRIFGSAFMMSLVSGGMAYAMDSANSSLGGTSDNGTSMQDEMTSALAGQLGQTTTTLLQKNVNIKPTLEIRPGYCFNIVVTKDMEFKQPYKPWLE